MDKVMYLFLHWINFFWLSIFATFVVANERDQGDLDYRHIQEAIRFRNEQFFSRDGELDLKKIIIMISRLKKERKAIASNCYESKIIDRIEIDLVDLKQARKSAQRQLNNEKNRLLFAIDQYLLPKLSELEILTKEFELIKIKKKTDNTKQIKLSMIL